MLAMFRRPPPPAQPTPSADAGLLDLKAMAEYRNLANQVGVATDAIDVEEFRHFLNTHDLPIFNRGEVVRYMDQIAAKTNPTGLGWQWCPVRAKDAKVGHTFGTPSKRTETRVDAHRTSVTLSPASDYYSDRTPAYARVMPLHALQKIALTEKSFAPDKVRFLVTDYVVSPHEVIRFGTVMQPALPQQVWPDPFLMAVVPNPNVIHGVGCFVIDVWDEPGFGLAQRLKPS